MSFILDALRKSEHDRQRAAMPGIAQVPFGAPRRQMPVWPMVVIAVLAVAVLVLGAAWWRSASRDAAAVAAPPAPAAINVPLTLPPVTVATPPAATYSSPPPAPRATDQPASPGAEPVAPAAPTEAPRPAVAQSAAPAPAPATAPVAATPASAPAPEPPPTDTATLPSAEALAAEGVAVPPLRLELHAYAPRAADRFVFINGSKYLEGATLAEGPRIVAIAPNGAVLSYLGRRFLLSPQ